MTVALEEVTSSDCKQTADVNNKLPSCWYYLKIASLGSKEETDQFRQFWQILTGYKVLTILGFEPCLLT